MQKGPFGIPAVWTALQALQGLPEKVTAGPFYLMDAAITVPNSGKNSMPCLGIFFNFPRPYFRKEVPSDPYAEAILGYFTGRKALDKLLYQHEELITQIAQLSDVLQNRNDRRNKPDFRIYSETDFKEMLEKSSTFSALAILNQMQLLLYQNPELQLLTLESKQAGILQPL